MKIGIIGAGKVGCSLGRYLREHGAPVAGYRSKSKESAEEAATFTGTKAFPSLGELVEACDVIFITTPDRAILPVWKDIEKESIQGKIVCHFSGSLSSVVFSGRDRLGVFACSIHPMYAFSNKFTSYQKLNQVLFTMEGDESALAVMKPFFEKMGNSVCVISPEDKVRYHAAAAMASNLMIGLYQMSLTMLEGCGFTKEEAECLIKPLVQNNVDALLKTSPEQALTGPIERNDKETIEKHLTVLNEAETQVYVNLSHELLKMAEKKYPGRDDTAIKAILEEPQNHV